MSEKKVCSNPDCGRSIRSKVHDKCFKCRAVGSTKQLIEDGTQAQLTQISNEQGIINSKTPKRSNFFIVMSNGKTPSQSNEAETKKFVHVIHELYVAKKILNFLHDIDGKDLILDNIEIVSGPIEVGDVRGKTNHHANVIVHHRNKLRINLPTLRDECKKILGGDMFIRIKLVKDPIAMTMNYANKNI